MDSNFCQGKRCLVTGGCGFIGSHLTRALLSAGAEVYVIDDCSRGRPQEGIEYIHGDLRFIDPVNAPHFDVDVVFHLAARVGGIGLYQSRPHAVLSDNLAIDRNVLALSLAANVPYFFYASSPHVDTDLTYGWAKLTGEKLIAAAIDEGYSTRFAVARIFGAYGPGQDFNLETGSVIPVLCHRAVRYPDVPYTLRTDGTEGRSFCYIDDVIRGIMQSVTVLRYEKYINADIGSKQGIGIGWLRAQIAYMSGKGIPLDNDSGFVKDEIGLHLPSNILPGWKPTVELVKGLRSTLNDVAARLGVTCGV